MNLTKLMEKKQVAPVVSFANREDNVRQSTTSDLETNIDLYNRNLDNVSEEQLGGMHSMNMSDLEMLSSKIKQQMQYLNTKYEEETGKTA